MDTITNPRNAKRREAKKISVYLPTIVIPETPDPLRCLDQILRTLASNGISTKMLHAVTTLYMEREREGGMSMGELSLRIGVSNALFTRVADGIERLGLASRSDNTNDRRITQFRLTESGLVFVEWISSCLNPGAFPHLGLCDGAHSLNRDGGVSQPARISGFTGKLPPGTVATNR